MGKNKAAASFHRLIGLGFIRRRADEPENYNLREANHWILTEFDFGKLAATKDFMSWTRPENLETRASSGTCCPLSKTISQFGEVTDEKVSRIKDENGRQSLCGVPEEGHSYNQSVLAE